jgi:CheY-like chemotaxis protein/anti-sigma regulatory factor (Ser/Thr protein kinase)
VRDLRVFAGPPLEEGSRAVSEVDEVIESAITLTRGRITERARLVKELSEVPPVLLDNGRLVQVIVNLLVNATQAVPKESISDPTVTISTRAADGRVEIAVSDNGIGIPKQNLQRIWAPFFTTKSADLGSGLGLSISREIIERAGGSIRVHSPTTETAIGPRGSRFVISLPAADEALRDIAPAPPSRPSAQAECPSMSVLIVEDEAPLAGALASEIGRVHKVVHALSAQRALALLSETRFDVVLCDLRMPGMSGELLYQRVLERDPAQARTFVFMSGIGFVAEVEQFLAATGRPVLHKPFAPSRVLELISNLHSTRHAKPDAMSVQER